MMMDAYLALETLGVAMTAVARAPSKAHRGAGRRIQPNRRVDGLICTYFPHRVILECIIRIHFCSLVNL